MAVFTEGEWRVERFVNGKGFEIAFNDDGEVVADYVYKESDAHLIAKSKKMYEMLESVVLHIENDSSEDIAYKYQDIKSLLDEARGETNDQTNT